MRGPNTVARYIWSTRHLAQAVGRNELAERDQFALFLVGQVVIFISGFGARISGSVRDWVSGMEVLLLFSITVAGIVLAYRANGGDHGREFVRKFALLSVPLALKFGLLSWPVFYALYGLVTMLTSSISDDAFDVVLRTLEFFWNVALTTAFFWRLVLWVRVAAASTTGTPAA